MENANKRITRDAYYLDIAKAVSERSTCLRKHYGAVIVNNDEIICTGYNGAPRGEINCSDIEKCLRIEKHIPSGSNYELCRSVHAEMNCIISASRKEMLGSILYLYGYDIENGEEIKDPMPCCICDRLIKNAGIVRVINSSRVTTYKKNIY